ncbi:inter-alpha-trypsin inhibitor heavy chain H3-like isoform X4 [Xyrauchen texanus]|uniref:inter-alpha-trypsin inhibitor heavy chain H3-like isoform X4 n=1 Tax=Xyrauchen texanus TaxID=154827 RepID=UPI002242A88D|nr:inter-alpha-trypsin inhibitor heavy chain H3-like isoform X4 [Xyrauchen texanus]
MRMITFGLITFDSEINVWKCELLKATEANLEGTKSFVQQITQKGATDINAAVLEGVNMIKQHPREGTASILILLTDGDPTAGETDTEKIMANVGEATAAKFPLYCLGFGYDVDFEFLTQMSLENNGLARRIYEDSDVDLQLQGFYDEVAIPLLSDIQLNYIGVTNLTKNNFNIYFNGSEIVVSGQIKDNNVENFIAVSKGNKITYQETVMTKVLSDVPPENENFMERLWAYLTVKQLLEEHSAKRLTWSAQNSKDPSSIWICQSPSYYGCMLRTGGCLNCVWIRISSSASLLKRYRTIEHTWIQQLYGPNAGCSTCGKKTSLW